MVNTEVNTSINTESNTYLNKLNTLRYTDKSESWLYKWQRRILIKRDLNWDSPPEAIKEKCPELRKQLTKVSRSKRVFEWFNNKRYLPKRDVNTYSPKVSIDKKVSIDISTPKEEKVSRTLTPQPNSIEVEGRTYTKEHLKDIFADREERREREKAILELQTQVNILLGQVQRLLLLKEPKNEEKEKTYQG